MERFKGPNLKDIGRIGAGILFLASVLAPTPANADEAAAFKLTALGFTEATCKVVDPDCALETTLIATNVSGGDLYRSTWFTGIHSERWAKIFGLKYLGFDGEWTWGESEDKEVVRPGESVITQVRYQPPKQYELYGRIYDNPAGRFIERMYIDGYQCKIELTPPDCIPYGGTSLEVTVNRIP